MSAKQRFNFLQVTLSLSPDYVDVRRFHSKHATNNVTLLTKTEGDRVCPIPVIR